MDEMGRQSGMRRKERKRKPWEILILWDTQDVHECTKEILVTTKTQLSDLVMQPSSWEGLMLKPYQGWWDGKVRSEVWVTLEENQQNGKLRPLEWSCYLPCRLRNLNLLFYCMYLYFQKCWKCQFTHFQGEILLSSTWNIYICILNL